MRRRYIYPIPLAMTVALFWPMRSMATQQLMAMGLLWYTIFSAIVLGWRQGLGETLQGQHRYSVGYHAIPIPRVPRFWGPPAPAKSRTQHEELNVAVGLTSIGMVRYFIPSSLPKSTEAMVVLVILTVDPGVIRVMIHVLRWRIAAGKNPISSIFPKSVYAYLRTLPVVENALPRTQPVRRRRDGKVRLGQGTPETEVARLGPAGSASPDA